MNRHSFIQKNPYPSCPPVSFFKEKFDMYDLELIIFTMLLYWFHNFHGDALNSPFKIRAAKYLQWYTNNYTQIKININVSLLVTYCAAFWQLKCNKTIQI